MKLFVCSDLHSFFTPFKKALDEKGFEPNNSEHLLIVCGDVFDRGDESFELFSFLNDLTNVVLIRGNHEDLLEEMLNRGYGERHDISNGTVNTVVSLVDYTGKKTSSTKECCDAVKEFIAPFLGRYINYFETKNYIFVHGWIPMKYDSTKKCAEYGDPTLFDENWREGDWDSARWYNGIKKARDGIIVPSKIVVAGHWHCSYGHMLDSICTDHWISEFEDDAVWEPYYSDGIIAIDRCTAHTGEVNVIVLEDELLETI